MIIAIVTAMVFLLGGSSGTFSFDALMDSFKAAVSDDSRLDQIEDILDKANDDIKAFRDKVTGDWADEVMKVHRDYNSTREQYLGIFKEIDAQRDALQKKLIERRFAIKSLMTAKEWAVYQADLKARAAAK